MTAIADPATRGVVAALSRHAPRTVTLADGSTGFFVRAPRTDDCLPAALATVLQVPLDLVPDGRIDERLAAGEDPDEVEADIEAELHRWCANRGLRMIAHRRPPTHLRRWIGIIRNPSKRFADHCVVCDRGAIVFDPTQDFALPAMIALAEYFGHPEPPRIRSRVWTAEDVSVGVSFRRVT